MSTQTLQALYATAVLVGVLSILSAAQIAIVSWLFSFICEELNLDKAYKGFKKFKKWAYAILFTTGLVSIATAFIIMAYFKVHL